MYDRQKTDAGGEASTGIPRVVPAAPVPTKTPLLCRMCGRPYLERSHRGAFELLVTWVLRRNAFRCRLCGWRGWLRPAS